MAVAKISLLTRLMVGTLLASVAVPYRATELTIASQRGPQVQIIVASQDPVMQRTAEWCRSFLLKRGYKVRPALAAALDKGNHPAWVLETRADSPVAKSLHVETGGLDSGRPEAYIVSVLQQGKRPIVSVVGNEVWGVRSAVARLVALMRDDGDHLVIPVLTERRSPFFPIRRLAVAPTGRIATGPPWDDSLWTKWSDERIRHYVEELWLCGFNSLEVAEIRGYRRGRGGFSDEELKTEVTPKLRVFMQACREYGIQVCQWIWGQSLFLEEGQNFCWNDRGKERAAMEQEYHRLAQTYGDLVDHIVVHVGDPGGCNRNGCDPYQTTQEITTFLLREFRKINPRVTATLSTWANEGFWLGKPRVQFLDETYSPQEVGIALHRWYDRDKARLVRAAGRPCDMWGWYLSDYEMELDLTLLMRRLDKYYLSLPEEASTQVRALSTELNFQGWPQLINAYVSAQKMWSPQRDLQEIQREFCAAVYGDKNADAMITVYAAAEKYVHPDRFAYFVPETDCLPVVFGIAAYNQELRAALDAGKGVKFDPSRSPKFTLATDAPTLWVNLMRRLSVISAFSEAQEKISVAKASRASHEMLQRIVDEAVTRAEPFKIDLDYPVLVGELKASISQPTGNLLANSGFEDGAPQYGPDLGTGAAAGWRYHIPDASTYVSPETKTVAYGPLAPFWFHSGKEAVRVSSLRGGRAELFQEVTVLSGIKYRAAVWVRALDADGQGFGTSAGDAAGLHIQELDEEGNVLVDHKKVQITKANAAYDQLVCDFETGANTVTVRYLLETDIGCNHWHGRVIYDDAVLEAR